jgi:7,8-dihydropterin-6-yl-methyl-4-(beta-D-ribofuranosyl)aminobenzene 5'-phosphate synthase
MNENLTITTLVDDTALNDGLLAEHGLSLWIEYDNRRILFDTGQSDMLIENARSLGINLAETNAIVLSHGHYDHTGGLSAVIDLAPKARIYMHPAATEPKFSRKNTGARSIGMPSVSQKAVQSSQVVWTAVPARIFAGIFATGQIPRINDFENVGGDFFLDENCTKSDNLLDDQTFFIESEKGLIVLFGCAHSGVVNTLDYISSLTNQSKIYAVIGGMHLLNASQERVEQTIAVFRKFNIQRIGPAHCTGAGAVSRFSDAFTGRCFPCSVGTRLTFEKSRTYYSYTNK